MVKEEYNKIIIIDSATEGQTKSRPALSPSKRHSQQSEPERERQRKRSKGDPTPETTQESITKSKFKQSISSKQKKQKLETNLQKHNSATTDKAELQSEQTCLTARSSPEPRFMPIYTRPKAPQPINSPLRHRIGGSLSLGIGGRAEEDGECLENTLDLRMLELSLSTRAPTPIAGECESSFSTGARNTNDRRTEAKISCI